MSQHSRQLSYNSEIALDKVSGLCGGDSPSRLIRKAEGMQAADAKADAIMAQANDIWTCKTCISSAVASFATDSGCMLGRHQQPEQLSAKSNPGANTLGWHKVVNGFRRDSPHYYSILSGKDLAKHAT